MYGELAALVERRAISAVVEATYPLEQYQAALRHAQNTGRAGKVLFTHNGAPEGALTMPVSVSSR